MMQESTGLSPAAVERHTEEWHRAGFCVIRGFYEPPAATRLREVMIAEFDADRSAGDSGTGPVAYTESVGAGAGARMLIYYGAAHAALPGPAAALLEPFFALRRSVLTRLDPSRPAGDPHEIQTSVILTAEGQAVEPHDDGEFVVSAAICLLHLSRRNVDYGGGVFGVATAHGDGPQHVAQPAVDAGDVIFFPPGSTHRVSPVEWGSRLVLSVGQPAYGSDALIA